MKIKTRDQIRAALVFEHIQPMASDEALRKKYGSLVLNAPTMIRAAGLLQSLAFYEAKGEHHHQRFLQNLSTELQSLNVLPQSQALREYMTDCDLIAYMRLTREVLALCQWHKRFAQSVLKVEPGGDEA